jgi:hypothetical protein
MWRRSHRGGEIVHKFDEYLNNSQVVWRKQHISNKGEGFQNGMQRPWILPRQTWKEGLWPRLRNDLDEYLANTGVQVHRGSHNLKSSWVLCANLYFPFRQPSGLLLLAGFLNERVSRNIKSVESVELEYAENPPLDPRTLLGEPTGGKRGANQTSPDVAFIVRTASGRGLVLTENKLSEHSFYPCSGRKKEVENPDPKRCLDWPKVLADPRSQCWQKQWEQGQRKNRRYWEHVRLSDRGRREFTQCPAAIAGYQLFRQQALAEAIAAAETDATGPRYDFVASCVAYDGRNDDLIHCLRSTGIDDFATGWGRLFDGRALFATWTHQEWVSWVREHDSAGDWSGWLAYVETRYGYTEDAR